MSMMMTERQDDVLGFRAVTGAGIDLRQALAQNPADVPDRKAEITADNAPPMRTGAQAWLWQARKAALLSREQEVDLARRIESARARQDWREERRVKEQLIAANLRLVANI